MLVLLIIFMLAAPLATVDTAVNPPSSNARPQQRPNKPIYLTLKSDLSLAIGDNPVACERLATALDAAPTATRRNASSCAPTAASPTAMSCRPMNELRAARYLKVSLVGLEMREAQ
jgi:biopolymer transport protein ExbD